MIQDPPFPKALSRKKQRAWLAANNPYAPGSQSFFTFEAIFYLDQSVKLQKSAGRALIWVIVAGSIALVASTISLVLTIAGGV